MAAFPGGQVWGPNPKCMQGFGFQINANPSGSKLVYGSGKNVVVRDYEDPTKCHVYSGMKGEVKVARFDRQGAQIGCGDDKGSLHILKLGGSTGVEVVKDTLRPLAGAILDVAWDADGKRIAAVGDAKGKRGNVIMISGTQQGEISNATKTITTVDIRPNCSLKESFLVHGSEDMRVRQFGYSGGYKVNPVEVKHENTVNMIRYAPDGANFISVGGKQVKMVNAETHEVVKEFGKEHKGSIYAVSFSPDGKQFITSSADKTVKLWDVESGKVLNSFDMKGKSLFAKNVKDMQVGCTFAGSKIVSLSLCGDINYLDEKTGGVGRVVQSFTGVVTSLAATGEDCVVTSNQGEVFSYLGNGSAKRINGCDSDKPGVGVVVMGGDTIYSTSNEDRVYESSIKAGAFSPNHFNLEHAPKNISAGGDNFITTTSQEVYVFTKGSTNPVATHKFGGNLEALCGAISPEGNEISIGFKDKKVRTFAFDGSSLTDSGKVSDTFEHEPISIVYSSTHMAVGLQTKFIKLFDRSSWAVIAPERFCFHNSRVDTVAFSPSGRYLASGGLDQNIIIWDTTPEKANRYKLKKEAFTHRDGVLSISWIDEDQLYSAGNDGAIKKW
eukprot:CAMPEP_0204823328 /NCGR_PEP_ID=MMETSP1346-20131115/1369_1 /ASSEMBLY_ACC=CAM_ASM_000771 /TAXON_ID=215587 /ORGANISM="Aplanochytrium stocchinoi, Strain GSBS06" /LENGTH=609 /DNA_ID=CAMNT_0051949911 /DNA_START=197 /DNA_END=2023 /DNA_ORIENTATION=-